MKLENARKVADAVLFEGYLLYPYRSTAQKNQMRWQFGVLAPRVWADGATETWFSQTELLVEPRDGAVVHVQVRCLQLQARTVHTAANGRFEPVDTLVVDGDEFVNWDEGVERDTSTSFELADLMRGERVIPFRIEMCGASTFNPRRRASLIRRSVLFPPVSNK